jgi:acyl-CoA thioesterase I
MLAAVATAASLLGIWAAVCAPGATRQPVTAHPVALRLLGPARGRRVSACERELEGTAPRGLPRLVIIGASFTAGVGSGPARSWAVLLARHLRWDAVVYGVPGAGYVRAGIGREGPVAAEAARLGLRALKPSLVIVQAGHDDIGVPPGLERQRVEQAIASIRAAAPRAPIALLTVFARRSPSPAAYRTDQAIVQAARASDRTVIIINPLTAGWVFSRARDGLHPTAAGSAWIASHVAAILRDHGVSPARIGLARRPVICDRAYANGAGLASAASPARAAAGPAAGRRNRISVPPSGGDSASTVPLWLSATCRMIASPRPEPGTPRAAATR